ncbi:MAG: ABC-type tungstate transport permease protein [Elusimicrobia bacterium]|nr:MAG: ABC-type tungstate transport permease protein [Elusimicrobiota bacterium]KAF0157888.1 MAG: ABC-type tungstate transport permease protein [Elusimicrobiota bacterium]
MEFIIEGFRKAVGLILSGNPEIFSIARLSLTVSLLATLIAVAAGVPLGAWIAVKRFPLKKLLIALVNTGMGLPPVVAGLVVMLFLARSGPLGFLNWLYTPKGMIMAQVVIALPIITALTISAMQSVDRRFYRQVLALGATEWQAILVCLRELRLTMVAAVIAGFGRLVAEVGAVMIVGGNIRHQTRMLTTATVMETQMGNFDMAIAIGLVLLALGFVVNLALTLIQQNKVITR